MAAWNFESGLADLKGELTLTLEGGAKLTPEGLKFDGKNAIATSTPLKRGLASKTIEVWVRLENLSQRGGGAMTIQSRDGLAFESIVFGEQEPADGWPAVRDSGATRAWRARLRATRLKRPVHVAITYGADGTIRLYPRWAALRRTLQDREAGRASPRGEALFCSASVTRPQGQPRAAGTTSASPALRPGARAARDRGLGGELPRLHPRDCRLSRLWQRAKRTAGADSRRDRAAASFAGRQSAVYAVAPAEAGRRTWRSAAIRISLETS